jgi:hypothetical protein
VFFSLQRYPEHLEKPLSSTVPHTHKKALATPRRPCSPEGRCAWARPQHAYATLNGRPERILPGHLGPAGAPRGGPRHAATIMGLESDTGQPRGSGQAQAAHERLQLTGLPSWAPWRRQADGERCPMPRHARAPHCRKKPVRRHRTQPAKARRVGPRRRRPPAPPCSGNALKHRNLGNIARNRPACMPAAAAAAPRPPVRLWREPPRARKKREGPRPQRNQTNNSPAPHVGVGQPGPP